MSSELSFEDKGKVRPKPSQEQAEPEKDSRPLTTDKLSGKLDARTLTQMQKTVGNAAVQRFLAQRNATGTGEVDEDTAASISAKRGAGQKLDTGIAAKAGGVMGQDFSGVNVHTDSQADTLSRQLGAKAFTTGKDIFFQEGTYSPGSSEGQRLISHELTHVVQQGASTPAVQGKMTVNDPNDQYEAEADKVADTVMNAPDESLQRVGEDEEAKLQGKADDSLQRADEDEIAQKADPELRRQEEEEPMPKADPELRRQEEEEPMPKADPELRRQEEEEPMPKADPELQRQEEEEPMPKADPELQRQDDEEVV